MKTRLASAVIASLAVFAAIPVTLNAPTVLASAAKVGLLPAPAKEKFLSSLPVAAPAKAPPATKVLRRMLPPFPFGDPRAHSRRPFLLTYLLASLRRRGQFGIDLAGNDRHHQGRGNVRGPEGPGDGVLDLRQAPQIGDDRQRVLPIEMDEISPRMIGASFRPSGRSRR